MGKRNYQFHRSELFRRLGWLVVPVLFWQLDTLGNLSIASIQESNNSTCQDCCDYWCTTMNCVKEAAQLWQLMNHSADPCVNFDEFACGKFYKEADIPDERGYAESWDISNEKIRKILEEILSEEIKPKDRHHQRMRKLFMKSCMDIEQRERIGLQPFLETKFAEEWPTLKGRAWKETKNFSLEEMVLLYSRFNPFFNIHVVEDHENLPHKAIDITPLETGFLDSFQYQRGRHSNLVMAYETKLREMAVELGADPVTAAQDAAAFVDWQAQFFKGKNFFLIDIMEFNLSSLYSNSNLSRVQTGNSFKKPLIRRCVEAVSNHFSLSLSKEYVNSAISNTAKNALAEMYERTKEIFREILNNTSWMARSSKQAALDKLESIALINVLPEEGFDDDSLDMVYKNFVMSGENYYENIETSIREAEMKNLRSLKDPSEDATWARKTFQANAYFRRTGNEIFIAGGLLQLPFYSPAFSLAFNYGSLASVVGHELGHGFDFDGVEIDKDGTYNNWWHPADKTYLKLGHMCFKDQYQKYQHPDLVDHAPIYVDGAVQMAEIFADNFGIWLSFRAFEKLIKGKEEENLLPGMGLNSAQVFFLAFAQTWCSKYTEEKLLQYMNTDDHAVRRFRIIGSMQNSPEFAKAFNCPLGSPMNPEKKCSRIFGRA